MAAQHSAGPGQEAAADRPILTITAASGHFRSDFDAAESAIPGRAASHAVPFGMPRLPRARRLT
jgi:hypothetical protein